MLRCFQRHVVIDIGGRGFSWMNLQFTSSMMGRCAVDALNRFRTNLSPFVRHCIRQVDYVAAQKTKRAQQWCRFYTQFYPWERLLQQLFKRMGRRLLSHHRRILFAGSAVAAHSIPTDPSDTDDLVASDETKAESHTISDDLIESHLGDLDYIHTLTMETLKCAKCSQRLVVDEKITGIDYCSCDELVNKVIDETSSTWLPFLERPDILVWRREHPEHPGLYAYKMYGRFDDVSAEEFLEVQLDTSDWRPQWDQSTANCRVIQEQQTLGGKEQIYYWEVKWPRFFSNRDYVASRRWRLFDGPSQADMKIVIYSRSITHPSCPTKAENFRVNDYWSVVVVKPVGELDAPGVEFCLTAFENPGISLPSSLTSWVAMRAMPDFMGKLRKACLELKRRKKTRVSAIEQSSMNSTKSVTKDYADSSTQPFCTSSTSQVFA